MYWYVLFVRTGREYKVEKFLKERLDANIFMPFIPLHEKIFKTAGTVKKELKPLFPSYVFIESEIPGQEFIKMTRRIFYSSRDIVSLLRYSDTEVEMKESERQILLNLSNKDYCIESSIGIIEGDRIYIIDGPLKGKESIVKKINRHKRQALVEIEFMNELRLLSLSLEIMKKI